jgi:outer membrane protein assembly factor BamB
MTRTLWRLPALLLLGCCLAADWPQFLGPQRNGISAEQGLLRSWPVNGPPVVWTKDVGSGFSGPAVVGESLILLHRVDDHEVVTCLDASTGKERWQYSYATAYRDDYGMGDGPRSTPLVADHRVYTLGAEGHLLCLELETGKKVWERSLHADYQVPKGFFGVATSPLLEGNLLLINVGGKGAGIVAFDHNTGREVWKATDHEASYSSPVVATLAGRRRVVFFTREGLVVLDPQTGAVQHNKHWRARLHASVNAASPVVINDDIFLSACYGTGAVLLHWTDERLDEIWKSNEAMSNHYNTCIHDNGYLYGFDGRQEEGAHLRCVELRTGKVCWTCERSGCGSMILANGSLIILSEDGDLLLVEATPLAYREKARARVLTNPCRSPIALANGKLYGRDGKKLVCWNLKQ